MLMCAERLEMGPKKIRPSSVISTSESCKTRLAYPGGGPGIAPPTLKSVNDRVRERCSGFGSLELLTFV